MHVTVDGQPDNTSLLIFFLKNISHIECVIPIGQYQVHFVTLQKVFQKKIQIVLTSEILPFDWL